MKKLLFTLSMSILVMFFVPLAVVIWAKADAGMAFMMLLFFAVNPIFSVWMGIEAGKDVKKLWFVPVMQFYS